MDELEIYPISQLSRITSLEECYDSLTDEELAGIKKVAMYGRTLHKMFGITVSEGALPLHIHPEILLSMIQEIMLSRRGR